MAREAFSEKDSTLLDNIIYWWRTSTARPHLRGKAIVADLGCGRFGTFLKKMESEITRGWGFDYGVDESSSTKKISLRTADLNETLPLEDGSVEAAVSLAVLEHVTDYLTCIKEAYRILKPGGLFVATTPRPQGKALLEWLGRYRLIDGREIDEHKRYFEKIDLIQAFKKAGFKDITWRSFEFGFNQIIIGKK